MKCSDGSLPDGKGNCSEFACADDTACPAGKQCKNPATTDAECVPCAENTSCSTCESGQIANGKGECVTPACSSDADCKAGNHCENAGKWNASCPPDPENKQGTCPDGYLADGKGNCVKIECTKDSDCPAGRSCKNGATIKSSCEPCANNAACSTCPNGQVGDGKGGCKAGCAFTSSRACVSGTANCSSCLSGRDGCYSCNACKSGFYSNGTSCESCSRKFENCAACSASGCTACKTGYKAVNGRCISTTCSSCYSWSDSQNKCVEKNCPSGYSTSTTWCPDGSSLSKTGSCGCAKCEKIPGYCSKDADCGSSQRCSNNKCVAVSCGACQTAQNHQCVAIPGCCTADSQCGGTERCSGNKCVAVSCGACQTAQNHQCVPVSG